MKHLSKTFRLPHERYHTLKERVLHPFRAHYYDELRAVEDVTVDIAQGEFFGIVGRNGSGKSTLLKCLAGIYEVDRGEVAIDGRLSPFIELGVGFNMDLAARDNVIINAIMLGLSRREARARFDDIVAFAELGEFTDLRLKNYSSGMLVRLAFATAIQVDAEILLIDEVLAVGDAAFQQKCFDEFGRLQRAGRTILFVTHDMGSVQRFCDRAMLLERGRVVDIDEPSSIARQYNQLNFDRMDGGSSRSGPAAGRRPPTRASPKCSTPGSNPRPATSSSRPTRAGGASSGWTSASLPKPTIRSSRSRSKTSPAISSSPPIHKHPPGRDRPLLSRSDGSDQGQLRELARAWTLPLDRGVARAGFGAAAYDIHTTATIIVVADLAGGGMADLPNTFDIDRA